MNVVPLPAGDGQQNSPTIDKFANDVLKRVEILALEVADVMGNLEVVVGFARQQKEAFDNLAALVTQLADAVDHIDQAGSSTRETTADVARRAEDSRDTIHSAIQSIDQLANSVSDAGNKLGSIETDLGLVTKMTSNIQGIAMQTNMLALNATIEAARAGKAGRGFSVVAGEVKELAMETGEATEKIDTAIDNLTDSVSTLKQSTDSTVELAEVTSDGVEVISSTVQMFNGSIGDINNQVDAISQATSASREQCQQVSGIVSHMVTGLGETVDNLAEAESRMSRLLENSEGMIGVIAESGRQTTDTPFIEAVLQGAGELSLALDKAVDTGRISMEALFDQNYKPIPGTNPQQHMAPCVAITDQLFPAVQERMLELNSKVAFSAAVDTKGYLPTHNKKFSQAQGNDPDWNNANSRNRRIFDDRTGLGAGQSHPQISMLQTYRRDMGGGKFVLMKDVSAPIYVRGRHWGGLRIGYKL